MIGFNLDFNSWLIKYHSGVGKRKAKNVTLTRTNILPVWVCGIFSHDF